MGYLVEWRVGSVLRAEGCGGHRDIVVLLRPGSSSLLAFGFEVSISVFKSSPSAGVERSGLGGRTVPFDCLPKDQRSRGTMTPGPT